MDFSIEELSIIALLLDEDEKKEKRRHWVHPIWKFRDTEGEFATLYRGLVDHDFKFYEYFRMSQNAFCDLLTKVEKYIKKRHMLETGYFYKRKTGGLFEVSVCNL